jgi:pimeloyl-ACP methyl ester carboxylesterase
MLAQASVSGLLNIARMTTADELIRDWPRAYGFENIEIGGTDGTRLRLVAGGPRACRPVVLLHGAPQLSYAWRRVMPLLKERYRVIAPDLRGYGASSVPSSGRYDMEVLVGDLRIVVDWARARYADALAGRGGGPKSDRITPTEPAKDRDTRAVVVGHDFGGMIAWLYAAGHPDTLRHVIAVNGPHPRAAARALLDPRQLVRSWHLALFQVPLLERLIERTDASLFLWMMTASSPRGTFDPADLTLYRAAFSRPGRAGAALAYYRQLLRLFSDPRSGAPLGPGLPPGEARVAVPSTVVWGDADLAMRPAIADAARRYVEQVKVRHLRGVSHWVPEERPEEIAAAVRDGDAAGGSG